MVAVAAVLITKGMPKARAARARQRSAPGQAAPASPVGPMISGRVHERPNSCIAVLRCETSTGAEPSSRMRSKALRLPRTLDSEPAPPSM